MEINFYGCDLLVFEIEMRVGLRWIVIDLVFKIMLKVSFIIHWCIQEPSSLSNLCCIEQWT